MQMIISLRHPDYVSARGGLVVRECQTRMKTFICFTFALKVYINQSYDKNGRKDTIF